MFHNIVVGKPLVSAWKLMSETEEDFETFDKRDTLFTEERFLPAVLVEAGVSSSRSEVRRNRPDLCITLDKPDCLTIKFGKNFVFVVVGE